MFRNQLMLKERLIHYRENNPTEWVKNIRDVVLLKDLLDYPEFCNLSIPEKAAAIIIGSVPRCACSNSVKFSSKLKSISPFGGWLTFCSSKCARSATSTVEKRKQTNIERYGTSSWASSVDAKSKPKTKITDEHQELINNKAKETSLAKYGVEHYSKTKEYLEKRNKTILENSGGLYTNWFQDVNKIKSSNIEKYGVEHYNQTVSGKKRLSDNNAMKNPEISQKSLISRMTNSGKYDNVLLELLLSNDADLFRSYIDNIAVSNNYTHRHEIAQYMGISYSYLNAMFRKFNMYNEYINIGAGSSYKEQEVINFIKSIGVEFKTKDRTILNGKEIDIVIESCKLGIEFDGMYYHSVFSGGKDKKYHLEKTELAEAKGYHLLHIFESEWNDPVKRKIWMSIIRAKLKLSSSTIFARTCVLKEITPKESKDFFNSNHLSGSVGASKHIGLFHEDRLVCALSYGKSRFNQTETEIYRFASLINTQVVGGFSKLLKTVPKENLVSFADRRISGIDSVYNKFFTKKEITPPCWWGMDVDKIPKHRLSYTKQKMKSVIKDYDESKTVVDNMFNSGYDIIWDCGNWKFSKAADIFSPK